MLSIGVQWRVRMKTKILLSCLLLTVLLALPVRVSAQDKSAPDGHIHDLVSMKLADDQTVKGGALVIDVKDGVVTLSGNVGNEKQKERAERLTRKVKGVKSVVNQIKVVKLP